MTTLRQSSIKTWLKCPRDYYEKYILELPQAFDINLDFGHRVHAAIENYHKGQPYEAELIKDYTEAYAPDDINESERQFALIVTSDIVLTGTIDGINHQELRDFKTSASSWSQRRADEDLQATAYTWAWYQMTGKLLPFSFIILRKDWLPTSRFKPVQVVTTSRTLDQLRDFELLCQKVAGEIEQEYLWECKCGQHLMEVAR